MTRITPMLGSSSWLPGMITSTMSGGQSAVVVQNGQLLMATRVTGRLEVGIKKDEQTGFVSLVRLYADKVENL